MDNKGGYITGVRVGYSNRTSECKRQEATKEAAAMISTLLPRPSAVVNEPRDARGQGNRNRPLPGCLAPSLPTTLLFSSSKSEILVPTACFPFDPHLALRQSLTPSVLPTTGGPPRRPVHSHQCALNTTHLGISFCVHFSRVLIPEVFGSLKPPRGSRTC